MNNGDTLTEDSEITINWLKSNDIFANLSSKKKLQAMAIAVCTKTEVFH